MKKAAKSLLSMMLAFAVMFTFMPFMAEVYAADEEQQAAVEMSSTPVGGVTYFYVDTEGRADDTVYQATVRSRRGATTYTFTKDKMTQVADTSLYYALADGVTPLSGTLYGYKPGSGTVKTYRDIYSEVGAAADESYDAVTSATHFTSHHAGDIPSLTAFGADAEGNKFISGVTLGRTAKTVDAETYVTANILTAAGAELTEEQTAAQDIVLKANPMNAPKEHVAAKIGNIEHATSKYGAEVFNIYPDDTVDGYVWNEYLDSIYAATISDGTTTVGAVYWIDLYGEKAATPGYHYNKVEFELNNGQVSADNPNGANVSRYAAFFNEKNKVKDGTYTFKIYAEGYDTVEATIDYVSEETQAAAAAESAQAAAAKIDSKNYTADSYAAVEAAKKALDEAVTAGDPAAIKEAAAALESAAAAAQTKAKATVKVSPVKKNLKAKVLKKKAQAFKIKASVSGKAKASFKKVSGNKRITVSKAGKVTVKKGTKKGTYKVKVRVSAPATANYKAAAKNVTLVIRVK